MATTAASSMAGAERRFPARGERQLGEVLTTRLRMRSRMRLRMRSQGWIVDVTEDKDRPGFSWGISQLFDVEENTRRLNIC